jgi:DNA-directed RNA polymerase subunit RPC12/RpoP
VANRIRAIDEKVKPVSLALRRINVEAVAREAGVPASTLSYDLNRVEDALPEVLSNRKPGPKPQKKLAEEAAEASPPEERSAACPECSGKVTKNGTYWVLNWLLMLTMGWLGVQRVLIQRWRCKECGHELVSPEQARQAEARRAWWSQVNRLVSLSRFKLGLSVRKIQILVKFVYARQVSIGHVERLTQRVGRRAEAALARLSECRQAVTRFLLYDETYPKMQKRAYSLGVAICEHGLIRSVRCITRKAKDIPAQLRDVVGTHFQPAYFLTDLDVLFNKYMKDADLALIHLRDRVHLIRQILRLFVEAVRDVTLDVPRGLSIKERKKQRKLKRRLLRKRLRPLLELVFKAFSPGYESVCVLMLEGVVAQLPINMAMPSTSCFNSRSRRVRLRPPTLWRAKTAFSNHSVELPSSSLFLSVANRFLLAFL